MGIPTLLQDYLRFCASSETSSAGELKSLVWSTFEYRIDGTVYAGLLLPKLDRAKIATGSFTGN